MVVDWTKGIRGKSVPKRIGTPPTCPPLFGTPFYEDFFSFAVATTILDLAGMSGSPILDAGGGVVGVGYVGNGNMLYGVEESVKCGVKQ